MSGPRSRTADGVRFEAEGLECIRRDRVLFSGLGFVLEPGTVLQVEGHNGSGKTSLLRILCGLSPPSEGSVRWCGTDIQRIRADFLADLVYVGHANGIKGGLTPVENLDMARALGQPRDGMTSMAALKRIGLEDHSHVPAQILSAGQQRRVALARMLALEARLWVLDEPFTALDRDGRQIVEALLDEHAQRGGMTVLTTHHQMTSNAATVQIIRLSE